LRVSLFAIVVSLIAGPVHSFAAKKKNQTASEPFAIIGGTTFRPPGFALPGVRVRVRPEQTEAGNKLTAKPIDAVTDSRGEFAIRVPAAPSKWTVDVSASGYQSQTRSVAIEGEQRVELSIILEPGPGKK